MSDLGNGAADRRTGEERRQGDRRKVDSDSQIPLEGDRRLGERRHGDRRSF